MGAGDRKKYIENIFKSVPQVYDIEAAIANMRALKDAREMANLSKKGARADQRALNRKDTHANAIISEVMKKSGWAGLVHAIAAGDDEYGNKNYKKSINPAGKALIQSVADELSNIPYEALTDKERVFMDVWNGKGEYENWLSDDPGVSDAVNKVNELKERSKEFTKKKHEQEKLNEQALDAAAGTGRHTVDIDINTPGQWRGFRVVGEGAVNGYAMRIEKDADGNKHAVGYLTFGDNQADTDHDKVFDRPLSEFNDNSEDALRAFKEAMINRLGKEEGTFKGKSAKIKQAKLGLAGDLLVGKDYDSVAASMSENKLKNLLRDNNLVVLKATNKIVKPEDVPLGADIRKVYNTKEEDEALRTASIPTKSRNLGGQEGQTWMTSNKSGKQTKSRVRNYTIDPETGEKKYTNKKGEDVWNKARTLKGSAAGNMSWGTKDADEKYKKAKQRQDENYSLQKQAERENTINSMDPQKLKDWQVMQVLKDFKI